MFEVRKNLGEVTMTDPESGIIIKFMTGDASSLVCVDMGHASASEYVAVSQRMTDYAYSQGLMEKSSYRTIKRREARQRLGKELKEAREAAGLSIREAEARTGVDKNVISRTEAGRANTTIDTINELAECYGCRLELSKEVPYFDSLEAFGEFLQKQREKEKKWKTL